LINPYTIDQREERATERSSVFEDIGKEMRNKGVEVIG
jgi:hypothetical protein